MVFHLIISPIFCFNFCTTGEYNGKVFSPDFEVFAGALDSQVGQILKRCIRTAGNAPEEKLFSTKNLKKYAKQLKVLYGLPSDGYGLFL